MQQLANIVFFIVGYLIFYVMPCALLMKTLSRFLLGIKINNIEALKINATAIFLYFGIFILLIAVKLYPIHEHGIQFLIWRIVALFAFFHLSYAWMAAKNATKEQHIRIAVISAGCTALFFALGYLYDFLVPLVTAQ